MRKTTILQTVIFFLIITNIAKASLSTIDHYIQDARLVGSGRFKASIDIYLYAQNGILNPVKPYALSIKFLNNTSKDRLVKTNIKRIKEQEKVDQKLLDKWQVNLEHIFRDIKKKQVLTMIYFPKKKLFFYLDQDKIGYINDIHLSSVLFDIWLGERTPQPKLRNKLLGKENKK